MIASLVYIFTKNVKEKHLKNKQYLPVKLAFSMAEGVKF